MHFALRLTVGCFMTLATVGCHRLQYEPDYLRVNGYRYSVGSAVVGGGLDTLRVAIAVKNDSRDNRLLAIPHCPPILNPITAILRAGRKKWDSDIVGMRKQRQYFDSAGNPIAQVCTADLRAMRFAPGAVYTYVLTVPIQEILGDSLPPGRYEVAAQLRLNGHVTKLQAADVQLRRQ
jgi:hypothetical protein